MSPTISETSEKILIYLLSERNHVQYEILTNGNGSWKKYSELFGISEIGLDMYIQKLEESLKELVDYGYIDDVLGRKNPSSMNTAIKITLSGRELAGEMSEKIRRKQLGFWGRTGEDIKKGLFGKLQNIYHQSGLFGIIKNIYYKIFVLFIFPILVAVWFYWENKTAIKSLIASFLKILNIL